MAKGRDNRLTLAAALRHYAPAETTETELLTEEMDRQSEGHSKLWRLRNLGDLVRRRDALLLERLQLLVARLTAGDATLSYQPAEPTAERRILSADRCAHLRFPSVRKPGRLSLDGHNLDHVQIVSASLAAAEEEAPADHPLETDLEEALARLEEVAEATGIAAVGDLPPPSSGGPQAAASLVADDQPRLVETEAPTPPTPKRPGPKKKWQVAKTTAAMLADLNDGKQTEETLGAMSGPVLARSYHVAVGTARLARELALSKIGCSPVKNRGPQL